MSKTQNQEEVLNFEKHFLKITSNFKQKERFEGFDFKKKGQMNLLFLILAGLHVLLKLNGLKPIFL